MASRKSEQSINHIVEAATRRIARQGYAHTSLLDIAKEAGMSKGAVHYHFPTKEALISAVLEHACNVVENRTKKAWAQGGDALDSVRSALEELWLVRAELSDEALVVADLLAQSLHDEKLRPKLAEYYRFAANQVTEHLAPQLDELGLKPKVPIELLPRLLNGLLDGLVMQKFVDPEALDGAKVIESLAVLAASMFEFDDA